MLYRHALLSLVLLTGAAFAEESPPPAAAAAVAAPTEAPPATGAPPPVTVAVRLQTELGVIVLAIEKERAPITAGNFLRYVDQKRFDGTPFYRALKVVGRSDLGLVQAGPRGDPKRVLKPIAHESTFVTGLSHTDGAISMARAEPGTANGDFFIIIGDLSSLDARHADAAAGQAEDAGYAVFGHVTEGMDVVHALLEQPTSETLGPESMKGQMLAKPVKILTARRAD